MSFIYKNPLTPLTALGNLSVQRTSIFGTNFSILSTGGYMEVYTLNDLFFTVPLSTIGLVEYSGNTIPIQLNISNGSPFSFDVLTLNSDNISSGRRRIGMLVYVIGLNEFYQYQIPNFNTLWNNATGATGIGGSTVVFSDFGTTIKSNTPEGIAFISAWTANTVDGYSGETASTAVWKKFSLSGGTVIGDYLPLSGGTVTGDTIFTSGLTANTISASTYLNLPIDVFVTGATYSDGSATFTNNTGGTFVLSGLTTPFTGGTVTGDTIFSNGLTATTISATTYENLPLDIFVTGGTYSAGTATFTNNSGGTFSVTGFNEQDLYITGGTFDKNTETLTLTNNSGGTVTITGFTDVFVTGGTYSNGSITFTNNSGTAFTVSGLYTGATDVFVTGGTYSAGTATFTNNTGGTFNVTGFYTGTTDVFVTGGSFSKSAETLTLVRNDNTQIPITGFTDIFVTGGTYGNGVLNLTNNSGSTFSISGFSTSTGGTSNYYGSFSDTTNQPVSGANIATVWTYNTTEISNGIYIQDGSKIKVSNDGIYEIAYSAQIEKTQGGTSTDVTIWAAINGNPIDRSSSTITLVSNSAYNLPFVSYILELYAGDYVEFYFSSPSQYIQLTTLSGLTSPTRPISPSVIIDAKAIGNAVLNTSGDSFVTGFSLTNDVLSLSQNRIGLYSGFSVNLPYLDTSGGTINGNLSVSGSVSATTYYGNGSNLTGISRGGGGGAGGQLYYFNISNTQTPYYEFSTTATTAPEQTISATASPNATVLIGGFMTPSTLPNIIDFPAGILSFYFHAYDGGTNHSFNIYGELYKRTTGGTETLLFTSDVAAVIGNVVTMIISDAYFSGTTLNSSDRLVIKIYGTNLTNQTRTIYFVTEGSTHYSFALTTIPTFTDTYVTGFTYGNNTLTIKQNNNQSDLTATINSFTGLTANTISATTYQNLPKDVFVTGGTYSNGTATFTNNTGGTFTVTGLTTPFTGGTVTGATSFTNGLSANTISATTYQNLPTDIRVTGGTYSNGTAIFTNNTGGTFNVTGFYTGATDVFTTGATYNNANTLTFTNNTGGTFSVSFNAFTGLTANTISATTYQNLPTDIRVTGATYNNANTLTFTNNTGGTFSVLFNVFTGLTATTVSATTYQNLPTDIRVTGGTYSANTLTFTNNTGGTFNVTGVTGTNVTGFTYNNANTLTISKSDGTTNTASINIMTGLTVNGNLTVTGVSSGSTFVSTQSSGDEGGQLDLYVPQTNTKISGTSVTIDVFQNKVRIFESGGNSRGAYIDITDADTGLTNNLLGIVAYKNISPIVVSSTTTVTLGQSIYIPANTFKAGDLLEVSYRAKKVGVAGTCVLRLNVNTTAATLGATFLSTTTFAANQLHNSAQRTMQVVTSNGNTELFNTTSLSNTDFVLSTAAVSNVNINWTVDQYIFTTLTPASTADTATSMYLLLKRIR